MLTFIRQCNVRQLRDKYVNYSLPYHFVPAEWTDTISYMYPGWHEKIYSFGPRWSRLGLVYTWIHIHSPNFRYKFSLSFHPHLSLPVISLHACLKLCVSFYFDTGHFSSVCVHLVAFYYPKWKLIWTEVYRLLLPFLSITKGKIAKLIVELAVYIRVNTTVDVSLLFYKIHYTTGPIINRPFVTFFSKTRTRKREIGHVIHEIAL